MSLGSFLQHGPSCDVSLAHSHTPTRSACLLLHGTDPLRGLGRPGAPGLAPAFFKYVRVSVYVCLSARVCVCAVALIQDIF
jgi:hypothetical protein